MPFDRPPQSIVIAGASSLLGGELKSVLEESHFAGWDLSLVDEDTAAGTLTEAGGEPSVIQAVEEGTFSRARLIFFTGSSEFTAANLGAARASGATVVDLSGGALKVPEVRVWFGLEDVGPSIDRNLMLYAIPSAPGIVAGRLFGVLRNLGLSRLAFVLFRPVSEAGRAGIEELEAQTSELLSFQSVGQPVFDTQVAFNLLDHYGSGSRESLLSVRERVRLELSAAVGKNAAQPAIQVLHAPVFYGYTFVAHSELTARSPREIVELLQAAGFCVETGASVPMGNLNASGDASIHLALPECDPGQPGTWWFWGAADNMRLPAATAVKLAEKLVE
jgi:aspartate-semialdehyde dehydrogenase